MGLGPVCDLVFVDESVWPGKKRKEGLAERIAWIWDAGAEIWDTGAKYVG
jgi:hypothetical protein